MTAETIKEENKMEHKRFFFQVQHEYDKRLEQYIAACNSLASAVSVVISLSEDPEIDKAKLIATLKKAFDKYDEAQ